MEVDARDFVGRLGLDLGQKDDAFRVEAFGVDAFGGREIGGQFAQSFAKLADGSRGVGPLGMIEGYREVDQGLKKETPGALLGSPGLFPDLVAFEELACVEEMNAAFQQGVHGLRVIRGARV